MRLDQALVDALVHERPKGPCVAALTYLYNHHELTVSTTHAHLNHDHCMETVILKGKTEAVLEFAQAVIAQPGVTHGQLNLIPAAKVASHKHRD